ncbi:MIX and LysM peptidoglycan-binding domain-containing protein [Salinivibrio sp. IB872]|uniref:MIX and LysM peptidoglycan-binding domain-containing protein n=1 Tax=Salinivibrio sp. IB872 TaxID=1766123 RepID=UPI000987B1E1|nr:LysM peptidoglycan-binding domain-containing protein [Salinivibrio sp. IB872]OOF28932.1 S-type Pyocin domain-containing protein [Salinivibrio sp. IB872]
MAYEFSQVEGDISSLTERDVSSIIPDGVSFSQFKEKLDSGEYVLLTDAPKQSAMVHDSVNKIWSVAPSTSTTLSPQAQSALSARANQSGNVAAGASGSRSASNSSQSATTSIEDTYVPEPVKPDRSDVPPALKYEYCFEIAASDDTFRKAVGCTFQLAKTEQEGTIGQWQTKPTEHGTKYTAYAAFDEPKKLVAKISADTMGVSVPDHVVMKPEGSAVVREAFIPVTPSIQLGERLGLPTEGYYYHFNQKRLVQEYKLLGNGKWQFYATRSTHEKLNHDQGLNKHQSAILVYWKLGGKNVEDQHLVYLKEAITREELDNLDDEWLAENGVKLSISDLLAAPKQAVANRDDSPAESDSDKTRDSAQPLTHTVKFDPTTRQRESWPAIAAQYGLSAKQLLELNPHYHAEPMSLAVGDSLTVIQPATKSEEKSIARSLPPEEPKTYNLAANTHYTFDGILQGTSVKPINRDDMVNAEISVVNLTQLSPQDVDDVYLVFADKRMSVDDFALETYLSNQKHIVEHVLNSNPHLKRSFSQIIEGMPLVISPWSEQHPDEEFAIKQADDLMSEFLTLSSEQKKWFAEHHETTTNALLMSAASGLDIHQQDANTSMLAELDLNHLLAGSGAVIAGAQVQGDKISKKMKSFADYSRYVASRTEGLSGPKLYSHPDYKAWRKQARTFQQDMKLILTEVGKPGYIRNIQTKRINNYLNVGKRQLYRARDFSKAISGIEMTALYKQTMSFSRSLGIANGLVIGAGLYGNAADVVNTCNSSGWFEDTCNRNIVNNTASGFFNVLGGIGVGIALAAIPVTGGLSMALVGGGSLFWGMYGGDLSQQVGLFVEEIVFD